MNDVNKFLEEVKTQYAIITGKYQRLTITQVPFVEETAKVVILNLLPDILKAVELVAKRFPEFKAEEKKEVAIKLLNDLINLPYIPEWLEDNVIKMCIDVVVHTLNGFFGSNWLDDVKLKQY